MCDASGRQRTLQLRAALQRARTRMRMSNRLQPRTSKYSRTPTGIVAKKILDTSSWVPSPDQPGQRHVLQLRTWLTENHQ
jgi:hypothetical protein